MQNLYEKKYPNAVKVFKDKDGNIVKKAVSPKGSPREGMPLNSPKSTARGPESPKKDDNFLSP